MTDFWQKLKCVILGHAYADANLKVSHLTGDLFHLSNVCVRCGKPYREIIAIQQPSYAGKPDEDELQ